MADRVRVEIPVAFYAGSSSAEALEEACRAQLASFKVPKRFERIDKLPRNAMGKVQKNLLRNPTSSGASNL